MGMQVQQYSPTLVQKNGSFLRGTIYFPVTNMGMQVQQYSPTLFRKNGSFLRGMMNMGMQVVPKHTNLVLLVEVSQTKESTILPRSPTLVSEVALAVTPNLSNMVDEGRILGIVGV